MSSTDTLEFRPLDGPSEPPLRARSGANIKVLVVRAMEHQYREFRKVHDEADRLIALLKRHSKPPPRPGRGPIQTR
jgi:hypothetical protein